MSLEKEMSFDDYVNIVRRKLPYVIGIFFLVFLGAIVYAIKLPPIYESTGTILIESQQVNSDQTREKFAADRFEALKQVVLSNENLFKIAEKYKLFGLDKHPDFSHSDVADLFRFYITVTLLKADASNWGEKTTFAFQVSTNYFNATDTYNIANDVVKLFLNENDRASKERVTDTAEFFAKEAEKKRIDLENIEKEVTSYKQRFSNSLPQNKDMQMSSLQRLEDDLRDNQREYNATQAELRSLDVSMDSAKAGLGLGLPQEQNTGPSELEKLKSEYAKLSSIYSDNHPTLKALQRRIDNLEKNTPSSIAAPTKSVTAQSVMVAKVQAQMDAANVRLKTLQVEEANIRSKIRQTEGGVMQSAQTEGVLGKLERDYETAKSAYAEVKAKQDASKIAQNIEMQNKGERFVLIQAPILPEKTIKPNRWLIILAGFIGAIVAAVGSAVMIEMFDKRIRGVDALVYAMKIQPMAVIPYITNKAELKRKKNIVSLTLASTLLTILVISLLVHIFIMPLDILTSKISARF